MEPVLPVEYVEFDHSVEETGDISQMSAEEYLSWVRHQASRLPSVFRAAISEEQVPKRQSQYMPQVEDIMQCPPAYLPDEEWEIDIIHSFSELRLTLARLSALEQSRERKETVPQMKDRSAWLQFCIAADLDNESGDDNSAELDASNWSKTIQASSTANSSKSTTDSSESEVSKRKRSLAASVGIAVASSHSAHIELESGECVEEEGVEDQQVGDNDDEDEMPENEAAEDVEEVCYPDLNQDLKCYTGGTLPPWNGAVNVSPSTTLLLQLDQVLSQKVFTYLVDHLQQRPSLSTMMGQWIYGLLARIEKPVCQATAGTIRQLYRRCCALRHSLVLDCESFDAQLAALNVLIGISGAYFGQGEHYVAFNHQHHHLQAEAQEEEEDEEDDYFDDELQDEDESGEEVAATAKKQRTQPDNGDNNNEGVGDIMDVTQS